MSWQDRQISRDLFFRVGGKVALATAGALTLASKVDVGPVHGQDLLRPVSDVAPIPPTDPRFETDSVFDSDQRERMRIVYGKGHINPQIALCYFALDPAELVKTGNSFKSLHPDQGKVIPGSEVGLFVDVLVAKKDSDFCFEGSIRYNGVARAAFMFDVSLDPTKPNLFNLNWDNYNVFDPQLNGQNIKGGWAKRFEI